jgi:hypothetical protein
MASRSDAGLPFGVLLDDQTKRNSDMRLSRWNVLAASLSVVFLVGCAAAAEPPQPDFRFGVMTDIHYGDKPDAHFPTRHYRQSLDRLKDCVTDLNKRDLAFAIQCGDIIDGYGAKEVPDPKAKSLADLDTVLAEYKKLNCAQFHVLGNHEMLAGMKDVCDALALPGGYYAFSNPKAQGWRFVVLDGNGLMVPDRAKAQLAWLEATLKQAKADMKRVVVFCHQPLVSGLLPHSEPPPNSPALKLIEGAGCVVACFYGHEHVPYYSFKNGIHHVILAAMIESSKDGAYGVVEMYADHFTIVGHGWQPSMTKNFAKAAQAK